MKAKYHLTFAKDKKYLPKKKKEKEQDKLEVDCDTEMTAMTYIREE